MQGFTATIPVENGRLVPTEGQTMAMENFLHTRDGKAVVVKLSRPTNTRTLAQNAMYWQMLGIVARETGNDSESLHEVLKDMLLPRRFVKLRDREIEVPKTTTQLSTTEFGEYIEKVRAFCAQELGIELPDLYNS